MEISKIKINDLDLYYSGFHSFAGYLAEQLLNSQRQLIIVHINLRNYYFMNKDKILYEDIKKNSIIIFEGIGLKICMALKGNGFLSDLNGTDLVPLFLKKLEGKNYKIFLLGGSEEAVSRTNLHIKNNYPKILIAGYHNGYFEESDAMTIVDSINKSQADILLISMGFPLQEKFVFKYRNKLNVKFIWNLGGLFDTMSGLKSRAPLFIRRVRLEWLYRFFLEPARMFHRNVIAAAWSFGNILFLKKD